MSSFDLQHLGLFNFHRRLATPVSSWEKFKIGGGTPPILSDGPKAGGQG